MGNVGRYDDRGRLVHAMHTGTGGYDLYYEYDQGNNRTRLIDVPGDVE